MRPTINSEAGTIESDRLGIAVTHGNTVILCLVVIHFNVVRIRDTRKRHLLEEVIGQQCTATGTGKIGTRKQAQHLQRNWVNAVRGNLIVRKRRAATSICLITGSGVVNHRWKISAEITGALLSSRNIQLSLL